MTDRTNLNAELIRKQTITLSFRSKAGHLAPSLSCVEILTVLFRDFLKFNIGNPKDISRDRLIFSKGHGAYAYYVILNMLGFIEDEELQQFYTDKSTLKGCLCKNERYMIEASTGSLGHGLPIAVGIALGLKMKSMSNKVVCIVGDGEMQEGSNFEALTYASRFRLNNLAVIVDANGLQAMDFVHNIGISNDRLLKVMSSFTDPDLVFDIDGHDEEALRMSFDKFFNHPDDAKGFCLFFCRTIKGKGLPFAENNPIYHFRCPVEDGYRLEDYVGN